MKARKLLAGILSAMMVIGTMVVPVSARGISSGLPEAVNNVISLADENTYRLSSNQTIDLTGKTIEFTGTDPRLEIHSNITIKGGTINIKVTDSADSVIAVGYADGSAGHLTLDGVNVNITDTTSATGVFSIDASDGSELTLKDCQFKATGVKASAIFYQGEYEKHTANVNIEGGKLEVDIKGDPDNANEAYDDGGALFFGCDVDVKNAEIIAATGRPTFRFSEGTVEKSKLDVEVMRSKDAVVNGYKEAISFTETEIKAKEGTKFATEGSATTDKKSTYNSAALSTVENVTVKEADKLPAAVDGVITLTEDVTLSKSNIINAKTVINLNNYTLTLTGKLSVFYVHSDTNIKNGNIKITDFYTADGVFYTNYGADLTFDNVKITADGVYPPYNEATGAYGNTTGVFRIMSSNSSIILNNTDVTTSNLYDTYLFYDEAAASNTSFEINGGKITMNNSYTTAGTEDHYSKSMFAYAHNAALDGVTVKADCGRALFRLKSNVVIKNSSVETNILRNSDAVADGSTVRFVKSSLKTAEGDALMSSTAAIESDDDTTYNNGKLVDAEGVKAVVIWESMTDSGVYGEDSKGVIRFSFKLTAPKSFGNVTKAGIKFVNTKNAEITEQTINGVEKNGAYSVFYGDIFNITENTGKYFARAYISNGTETAWSDMVECSVDSDKVFADYAAE